jgi:hypothetical protein
MLQESPKFATDRFVADELWINLSDKVPIDRLFNIQLPGRIYCLEKGKLPFHVYVTGDR